MCFSAVPSCEESPPQTSKRTTFFFTRNGVMAHNRKPPASGGGRDEHPNYAAMAETLEGLARELTRRAEAENDAVLSAQAERLLHLAQAIRSDLRKTG